MNYIEYMEEGEKINPYNKTRNAKHFIFSDRPPVAQLHYFDFLQYLNDVISKIKNSDARSTSKVSSGTQPTNNTQIRTNGNTTRGDYTYDLSSAPYSGVDRFTPLASK